MTIRLSSIEQRIEWSRGFRCETDKKVLRTIARWYAWRLDGTGVRFTIDGLAEKSGIPKRTIDRALRRLERRQWLEATAHRHRKPTTYRIVVERLATEDPDQMRAATLTNIEPPSTPQWRANEGLARHSGAQETCGAQGIAPDFEEVARQSTEEEVRTDPSSSSSSVLARHSGAQASADRTDVAMFLGWWIANYPLHNQGAQPLIDQANRSAAAQVLDAGFSIDQLHAMAIALWTLEPGPDPHRAWIVTTDRSICVLRHKATFLSRLVVGAAIGVQQALSFGPVELVPLSRREIDEAQAIRNRVYGGCPHDPHHADWRDCVREIALARRVS